MFELRGPEKQRIRECVVALVERDGLVLLGQKGPGIGPYPGTWRIPGGGIEPGESNLEALARELREETGLELVSAEPILYQEDQAVKDGEPWTWHFFIYAVEARGVPSAGSDLVRLEWFAKERLAQLPLPPVSVTLFEHLGWLK